MMVTLQTSMLELLELHPETEAVFEQYTRRIGICICCEALFCTIGEVANRYEIESDELISRLESVLV